MFQRRLVFGLIGSILAWESVIQLTCAQSSTMGRQPSNHALSTSKIHDHLYRLAQEPDAPLTFKAWIFFTDKNLSNEGTASRAKNLQARLDGLADRYHPRAIKRRKARRTRPGLFDLHDLPVSPRYVQAIETTGPSTHITSKWLNAVSVVGTIKQFEQLSQFDFVKHIQPVRRSEKIEPQEVVASPLVRIPDSSGSLAGGVLSYGLSETQIAQINLIDLHNQGFTGAGVVIGILDTGFLRSHDAFNQIGHPLNVIAEFDFVSGDSNTARDAGDVFSQPNHGTFVLGILGAYFPGQYLGAAFDASFILCKTEDITAEYIGEEDNFVAGLEFIETNGGDVVTSSLGYIDWYTQADLDGLTAITTKAVNIATANGLFCLNAAGNAGHDFDPSTSALIAPADALQVITCGAVSSSGGVASFSSDGPTADGRVKPELLAQGIGAVSVATSDDTAYASSSGTSFSTPLIAGAVACLVQAHPDWTVDKMRNQLFHTASIYTQFGLFDPNFIMGYGIVDAGAAHALIDCNENGIEDALDIGSGTSLDMDFNGVPDECQTGACCTCNCQQTNLSDCNAQEGLFAEDALCENANCPDSRPINDDCADALDITGLSVVAINSFCSTTDGPVTLNEPCTFDPPDRLGHDIWYHYTASCTGLLVAELVNADFEGYVTIYCEGSEVCSCPIDATSQYACDAGGIGIAFDVPVSAGNCYTIRVSGLDGAVGTAELQVSCIEPALLPPLFIEPGPDYVEKNRFLTIQTSEIGVQRAFRVTLVSLPPPFDLFAGEELWIGPPQLVSENSGVIDPADAPDYDSFTSAALQCDPFFTDWSAYSAVHVHHRLVVPGGQYLVVGIGRWCYLFSQPTACYEAINTCACDCTCPSIDCFSSPLQTASWGDVVGDCSNLPCTPPDGSVDVTTDVTAILDKFRNLVSAPIKVRVDIEPLEIDFKINFTDITFSLDAFRGFPFPFAAPTNFPCDP